MFPNTNQKDVLIYDVLDLDMNYRHDGDMSKQVHIYEDRITDL